MDEQLAEALDGIGLRDHSVTAEYRIYGPPGTGKTTNLTRQIRRAVDRFGDNSVLVTSFSRATAAEVAGRDVPIASDCIGTLHSHCFHALGEPAIAEGHVDEWNRENQSLRITPVARQIRLDCEDSVEEDADHVAYGDRLLQQLNCCRGMMLELEAWPATVREFASRWNRYKAANGLMDFCDLIETALHDVSAGPNNPAVIVVDEAQDLNRLQLTLARAWGERARYLVFAGDDDQTIYVWAGASPDAILDPDIPEDHKIFLNQSERVPRSVHAVAERLIHQVSRRQEKVYLPRPADGEVHRLSQAGYRSPEYCILKTAESHIKQGQSIMFLASCSYMLHPIVAVLRKNGIPFHNPYRKSNGFWNPLRIGSRHSAANRIVALLIGHPGFGQGHRNWKCGDLVLWLEWLRRGGVLKAGSKAALAALPSQSEGTPAVLQAVLEPASITGLLATLNDSPRALLGWWRDRVAPDFRRRIQFPADIAAMHGPQALRASPQVVVGTIHSVKGGQADVVYLFPDLSKAGDAQYHQHGPARDSVIRVFYVGATRARETLYICSGESAMAVPI
jgi:DNA helicase-2/ATP-dependent DNA helicase PcrA